MINELNNNLELTAHLMDQFRVKYPGYEVISSSVAEKDQMVWCLVKNKLDKKLLVVSNGEGHFPTDFSGSIVKTGDYSFFVGELNTVNARIIRDVFPYTRPVLLGKSSSFGFGDRLGNAGAAHLKSLEGSSMRPVLAQQSIRELNRTNRSAAEVIDASVWAVFQEGYRHGYGADADHLKTTDDIDRTLRAGFTMFTFDPSDHVDNRVNDLPESGLKSAFCDLPWDELQITADDFLKKYRDKTFRLPFDVEITISGPDVLKAMVKYGRVLTHTKKMYVYLKNEYAEYASEVELSVDETPYPTTPAEHLIISSELQRLGVELVSLAPRFSGKFEKGIDFKGDLDEFRRQYILHQAIAATGGGYKLSIHSGSDKFKIYEEIGDIALGSIHIKTAGTSYLEALRAISLSDPELFREICDFARSQFDTDKKTYFISADAAKLDQQKDAKDSELPAFLDDDDARQILHVTFGSVLTIRDGSDRYRFRNRIIKALAQNEETYENCLIRHFRKHLVPFE